MQDALQWSVQQAQDSFRAGVDPAEVIETFRQDLELLEPLLILGRAELTENGGTHYFETTLFPTKENPSPRWGNGEETL